MKLDEVKKIIFEKIKDELVQKPKTASELNNPMNKKKDELYNAIFCYDKNNEICGYNIQVRLEENEIYKLRYYLPIADDSWKNVKTLSQLPDKEIKIGFEGEYVSQNEVLRANSPEIADAMYLNLNANGIIKIENVFGLTCPDALYLVARNFKYTGYPVNDATKQLNKDKLFV